MSVFCTVASETFLEPPLVLCIPKTPERHLWVPLIPVLLPSHPLQSGWEPRKLLGSYDPRPFFPSSPPHSLPFTHPEPVSTFPVGSERLDNPRFHLGPGSRSPDRLFWPYWNPEPSLRASQAAPAPGPVGAARGPPFLRRVTQGQRAPLLLAEAGARTGPPKHPPSQTLSCGELPAPTLKAPCGGNHC